jgi:hypothetical protein
MTRRGGLWTFAAVALLVSACGGGSTSTSSPTPTPATAATSTTAVSAQSAAGTARVVIDPTHGSVGTVLQVTGSGYAPGIVLSGALCTTDAQGVVASPLTDCDVLDVVSVTTDATGSFTTTFTVKRIPPKKSAYQVGFGRPGDSTQSAGAVFTVDG